jgi:hypothetical protein
LIDESQARLQAPGEDLVVAQMGRDGDLYRGISSATRFRMR